MRWLKVSVSTVVILNQIPDSVVDVDPFARSSGELGFLFMFELTLSLEVWKPAQDVVPWAYSIFSKKSTPWSAVGLFQNTILESQEVCLKWCAQARLDIM